MLSLYRNRTRDLGTVERGRITSRNFSLFLRSQSPKNKGPSRDLILLVSGRENIERYRLKRVGLF